MFINSHNFTTLHYFQDKCKNVKNTYTEMEIQTNGIFVFNLIANAIHKFPLFVILFTSFRQLRKGARQNMFVSGCRYK